MKKVTTSAPVLSELEAQLKALRLQVTELKKSESKVAKQAAAYAMTAHTSDAEVALIAKSDAANPFAGMAIVAQTPSKKSKRGHSASGVRKIAVHLDRADVLEVVALYNEGHGLSKSEIARRFNVNPTFIANIVTGREHSKITGIVYTPKAK